MHKAEGLRVCLVTAGFFHRLASLRSEPGLCFGSLLFFSCVLSTPLS